MECPSSPSSSGGISAYLKAGTCVAIADSTGNELCRTGSSCFYHRVTAHCSRSCTGRPAWRARACALECEVLPLLTGAPAPAPVLRGGCPRSHPFRWSGCASPFRRRLSAGPRDGGTEERRDAALLAPAARTRSPSLPDRRGDPSARGRQLLGFPAQPRAGPRVPSPRAARGRRPHPACAGSPRPVGHRSAWSRRMRMRAKPSEGGSGASPSGADPGPAEAPRLAEQRPRPPTTARPLFGAPLSPPGSCVRAARTPRQHRPAALSSPRFPYTRCPRPADSPASPARGHLPRPPLRGPGGHTCAPRRPGSVGSSLRARLGPLRPPSRLGSRRPRARLRACGARGSCKQQPERCA